jgi:hypothetical protein
VKPVTKLVAKPLQPTATTRKPRLKPPFDAKIKTGAAFLRPRRLLLRAPVPAAGQFLYNADL